MLVWRICREPHAATAFSGEGARLVGGRWNSMGVPMAYASDSLALAALELFVHIGPSDQAPADLVAIQAEIAVDVQTDLAAMTKLPGDWRFQEELSRRAGDRWAKENSAVAVRVPSVVVDVEWNVLINPEHPGFGGLKIIQKRPFRFDERMFSAER